MDRVGENTLKENEMYNESNDSTCTSLICYVQQGQGACAIFLTVTKPGLKLRTSLFHEDNTNERKHRFSK